MPDFVVIGAQKCGTTTFYNLLTSHERVEPAALKELHYFDDHFDEGIEWYRRCFPSPHWKEGRKTITGEATLAYIFCSDVPERMAKYIPNAKLIVLLRNPVDRAYSHYHSMVRLNAENLDFEAAIRRDLERMERGGYEESRDDHHRGALHLKDFSYLSRGIYADQLSRWLKFFDRERIFVAKSEDFYRDVSGTLKNATEFLGLPDWEVPVRKPSNTGQYPPMNLATRRWLSEYFEPHNRRLYELLHEDFGW